MKRLLFVWMTSAVLACGTSPTPETPPPTAENDGLGEPPVDIQTPDKIARTELAESSCKEAIAALTRVAGEAYNNAVGNTLLDEKGMSVEALAATCTELNGQTDEQVLAKFVEISGLKP
ncbi:MAG: hypothetical protein ACON5B_12515 [Myxococcota bacterium]